MRMSGRLFGQVWQGRGSDSRQGSPRGDSERTDPQVRPHVVAPLSSGPHRNPRWRSHSVTVSVGRSEIGEEHSCPSESSLVLLSQ